MFGSVCASGGDGDGDVSRCISHSPSSPLRTTMHPLKSVAVSAQVIIFSAYEGWKALAINTVALRENLETQENLGGRGRGQQLGNNGAPFLRICTGGNTNCSLCKTLCATRLLETTAGTLSASFDLYFDNLKNPRVGRETPYSRDNKSSWPYKIVFALTVRPL